MVGRSLVGEWMKELICEQESWKLVKSCKPGEKRHKQGVILAKAHAEDKAQREGRHARMWALE